jgi:SAM-dependent methyltransferase
VRVLDEVNLRRYETNSVGRTYARSEGLQAPEAVLLEQLRDVLAGVRILDLGVGAGRTTPHLLAISEDYVGVDYSSRMVELCRGRFPDTRFEVHDARDLSSFRDGEFGFVMFAFNGIDCLEHPDRLSAFREIHRVLADGGWFVFSSHNRDSPPSGFRFPAIDPAHHPLRRAARAAAWVPAAGRASWNRVRLRRYEVDTDSYAIRNDSAHEHALLTYYIRAADQRAQLQTVGFTADVATYALDGKSLRPDEPCDDAWIYYCVQKQPAAA